MKRVFKRLFSYENYGVEQYNKGYADGLARVNNATVTYKYHSHNAGGQTIHHVSEWPKLKECSDKTSWGITYYTTSPGGCYRGPIYFYNYYNVNEDRTYIVESGTEKSGSSYSYILGPIYVLNCGKSTSTIEGATLTW